VKTNLLDDVKEQEDACTSIELRGEPSHLFADLSLRVDSFLIHPISHCSSFLPDDND